MPGPRMGARPADFDEDVVRRAPTFQRWQTLADGQKIRYACRDFVKGHGDDEERLMRRIMIARRNNLRDHETLKKARASDPERVKGRVAPSSPGGAGEGDGGDGGTSTGGDDTGGAPSSPPGATTPERRAKRRKVAVVPPVSPGGGGGEDIMDEPAVEATRSYRAWLALEEGGEFTYNQKYVKGREGHDHLLRKNIWRRMRYRRENKKMVERMKASGSSGAAPGVVKSEECDKHGGSPNESTIAVKTEDDNAHAAVCADITLSENKQHEPAVDPKDDDKQQQVKTEDEAPCDKPPAPAPMEHATTIQIDGSALDAAARIAAASTTSNDAGAIEKSLAEAVAAAAVAGEPDKEEEEKLTAV